MKGINVTVIWIVLAANILLSVILVAVLVIFFGRISEVEDRLSRTPTAAEIDKRIQGLEDTQSDLISNNNKVLSGMWDRIAALEKGTAEQQPEGPRKLGFLLADLERQVSLKMDAKYRPDDEAATQEKIDKLILELERRQREGEDVITPVLERARLSRDPDFRLVLMRDTIWRMGSAAIPGIMELFNDREFTSNLRVVAAVSALKAGGNKTELLQEFADHLGDLQEKLTVRTGLAREVFREYPFEGAVKGLIEGARSKGYPYQHRTECLITMRYYEDPQVIRALEEIIHEADDEGPVIIFAVQAYHKIMGEGAVPFLKEFLARLKPEKGIRQMINDILKKYPDEGS